MKKSMLLAALLCSYCLMHAQSALRYNMVNPTFLQTADTNLVNLQTANPTDTSEGGTLNSFSRWVQFNSNRMAYNDLLAKLFAMFE